MKSSSAQENPLGILPVNQPLARFAIPNTVAVLVSALYNIAGQSHIRRGVGMLGNAATNVAFPLTITCTVISLMCGIGETANFNLSLDSGEKEEATRHAGNAVFMLTAIGISLRLTVGLFLRPLMTVFGITPDVLDYSLTYTGIMPLGFPSLILTTDGSSLIRTDDSPHFSMVCILTGAVLNTILDSLPISGFHMGMAGAALTAIIGQIISGIVIIIHLTRFKTARLSLGSLVPVPSHMKATTVLGMTPFSNQMAVTVVQTIMNNILRCYGAQSRYRNEIPLACVDIITKVDMILFSLVIGLSQGLQSITSFNYGARKFGWARETYLKAVLTAATIPTLSFLCFQLTPRQIIGILGSGSGEYFYSVERHFRIFLFLVLLNRPQPITANYFTSIRKAAKGIFIFLTRQIIFLLPLIVVLPMFLGIEDMMYSVPVVDPMTALLALVSVIRELRKIRGMGGEMNCGAETADQSRPDGLVA